MCQRHRRFSGASCCQVDRFIKQLQGYDVDMIAVNKIVGFSSGTVIFKNC